MANATILNDQASHAHNADVKSLVSIARYNANDPSTTTDLLVSVLERDGGVIVENIISKELAIQIKSELQPYFDTEYDTLGGPKRVPVMLTSLSSEVDRSGFFPRTTQRASGLLAKSAGCVDLAMNKTYIDVANKILSSKFSYWDGQELDTVTSKPIISSTVGFRINPGGKQQALHRDDSDYHARNVDMPPVMMGCVPALTRTRKENGATICIPGSHLWGPERAPLDEEAVPAELEIGSALIFLGNLYHAGGSNVTKDGIRETVGIFLCKAYLRPAENQFIMVPPEKAKHLPAQVQRLLGYGISPPQLGFVDYKDPMRVLFGVEDEETDIG